MIDRIDTPAALARVTWLRADEGGRRTGPPTGRVYAANCSFPLGGEPATVPGWPASAEKFSLLLQVTAIAADGTWDCKLDFLARDMVTPFLHQSAEMLIMEGPKIVGRAIITAVLLDGAQMEHK